MGNKSDLEVSGLFHCSKKRLFEAWTRPKDLKQWWKPMGKSLEKVENNVTDGGTLAYSFDNKSLLVDGVYEKVVEDTLLVYSWNWHVQSSTIKDAAYKVYVRFDGDGNESAISIIQNGFNNEEHIRPHREGWEQALSQLEVYLNHEREAAE